MAAFVGARLDEDEATAKDASWDSPGDRWHIWGARPDGAWVVDDDGEEGFAIPRIGGGADTEGVARHIARHDPARVLREVTAKRKRLALMTEAHAAMDKIIADDTADRADQTMAVGRARAATVAVKYDAAVWSDHADYKGES